MWLPLGPAASTRLLSRYNVNPLFHLYTNSIRHVTAYALVISQRDRNHKGLKANPKCGGPCIVPVSVEKKTITIPRKSNATTHPQHHHGVYFGGGAS